MINKVYHSIFGFLTGFLLLTGISLHGQQSNTFYLMHDVPQSNLLNPAVQLACKWYIGLPAIASTYSKYSNTAFTYNDLAGGANSNFESLYKQLHKTDLISFEAGANLISLGYRHNSNYFTINIADRMSINNTLPRDLSGLALFGNGQFIGKTADLSGLRVNGLYFREYAFGYSRVLDIFTTLGIRLKLLFGKANVYSENSQIGLTTDENSFDLHLAGNYTISSSLPITINYDSAGNISGVSPEEEIDYRSAMLNRQNEGFAIDFGVIYHYNSKITLSASLLDLGIINWKSDLNTINLQGSFDYTGAHPDTDFSSGGAYLTDLRDSLYDAFDVTVSNYPYYSWLPTQLFLGGTYHLKPNIYLGLTNRNVIFRKKIHSSFTLSANADVSNRLLASVSWSYLNNSIKNIGVGLAVHGNGMQFHIVSDNILGYLQPFDTRSVNLRVGFNLMLGCPRDKREAKEQSTSNYSGGLPDGNCGSVKVPKFRKKYRKEAEKRNRKRK